MSLRTSDGRPIRLETWLGMNPALLFPKVDLIFFRRRKSYFLLLSSNGEQPDLELERVWGNPDVALERLSVEQGLVVLVLSNYDDYPQLTPASYVNLIAKYRKGEAPKLTSVGRTV